MSMDQIDRLGPVQLANPLNQTRVKEFSSGSQADPPRDRGITNPGCGGSYGIQSSGTAMDWLHGHDAGADVEPLRLPQWLGDEAPFSIIGDGGIKRSERQDTHCGARCFLSEAALCHPFQGTISSTPAQLRIRFRAGPADSPGELRPQAELPSSRQSVANRTSCGTVHSRPHQVPHTGRVAPARQRVCRQNSLCPRDRQLGLCHLTLRVFRLYCCQPRGSRKPWPRHLPAQTAPEIEKGWRRWLLSETTKINRGRDECSP